MPNIILTTASGIEEILREEISEICPEIRSQDIKIKPGQCRFEGSLDDVYALCLHSRLANRVLWVLASGPADNANDLYNTVNNIDWPMVFAPEHDFAISSKGTNRELKNTQFISQKSKDAIVDCFQEEGYRRPNVDKQNAKIHIQVRVFRDKADICVDMSGTSLHLRGYRLDTGDAPLKENVAMAMLYRSGWTSETNKPLLDPMCGSGTIAIEAAMYAAKIPPNLHREHWGFDYFLGHNKRKWQMHLGKAQENIKTDKVCEIYASDLSTVLVEQAKQNAIRANVEHLIEFKQVDVLQYFPTTAPGIVVSNPPYGERLGEFTTMLPLYDELGRHLKESYADWLVCLLCSDKTLLKALKLKSAKRYQLYNGSLACEFALYNMQGDNLEIYQDKIENDEFSNRIKKNQQKLSKWLKTANTQAYRLYDADLPNYNFAIDVYADWVILQEYKAPKSIPETVVKQRLQHAILVLPKLLSIPAYKLVIKLREKQSGQQQYQKVNNQNRRFVVQENQAKFWINPKDYLDVGLFLDHRDTRQMFASQVKGKNVLNLFCYTGSVSVHAALRGAKSVTSVDMSNTYIQWAKDNFALNKLKGAYSFEQADCLEWVKKAKQQDNAKFDAVFLDPPSFSNSKRMESTWDVQRDHLALISDVANLLNENGFIYFSTNLRTFKLQQEEIKALGFDIKNISDKTLPFDFQRNAKIHSCWILTKCN
ncbi:bifunctional 23S rRNA (guanine(2069)-N(7))-methyltransferase RlmK/23S rRNA (guanine(2445)-N(2))-methyltransferase RlmL [Glaciecola sp. 1036]|uniref:bifunctional 23S rRNA (guanine(2069)-N(7))-methyltransferase RlmK/23S rRNA (guanine(2445)-N(2))-methyltransferase RlmL n=1 Tax=Alteromonadaceae TaxID=72275 RepID=UPI003D022D39